MQVKAIRQPSQELLDDLCSRFILNVPADDLQSFERLLFVVEQAHWFYEDTLRAQHPDLRCYGLRDFTVLLFQSCACLAPWRTQVHQIYDSFNAYKVKVPVAGAVVLDSSLQYCLLVKGWKSQASWGFPKGKKSRDEEDSTCAAREVLEETGLDVGPLVNPEQYLETSSGDRRCRLFIVSGVDISTTRFEPQTQKEISEIGWHSLKDLAGSKLDGVPGLGAPTTLASKTPGGARLYMVQPYVRQIVAWVAAHHTPQTRALAAQRPVFPGQILTCYKAKAEEVSTVKQINAAIAASPAQHSQSSLPIPPPAVQWPASAATPQPGVCLPSLPSAPATQGALLPAPSAEDQRRQAQAQAQPLLAASAPVKPITILKRPPPGALLPQPQAPPLALLPQAQPPPTHARGVPSGNAGASGLLSSVPVPAPALEGAPLGLLPPPQQGQQFPGPGIGGLGASAPGLLPLLLQAHAVQPSSAAAPSGPLLPHQLTDALGKPLFSSLRKFQFELKPIMDALEFRA